MKHILNRITCHAATSNSRKKPANKRAATTLTEFSN